MVQNEVQTDQDFRDTTDMLGYYQNHQLHDYPVP